MLDGDSAGKVNVMTAGGDRGEMQDVFDVTAGESGAFTLEFLENSTNEPRSEGRERNAGSG